MHAGNHANVLAGRGVRTGGRAGFARTTGRKKLLTVAVITEQQRQPTPTTYTAFQPYTEPAGPGENPQPRHMVTRHMSSGHSVAASLPWAGAPAPTQGPLIGNRSACKRMYHHPCWHDGNQLEGARQYCEALTSIGECAAHSRGCFQWFEVKNSNGD